MARSYGKLFNALRSTAVKAVLLGKPPGAEEWSVVVNALIGDLVAGPDATLNRLVSLESKLDDLIRMQFIGPLKTAQEHLGYAMAPHRSKKERRRMLEAARHSLLEALPHAPDRLEKARVHWCLAMDWLAAESVEDCRNELYRAGRSAFNEVLDGLAWARNPSAADVEELARMNMPGWERAVAEFGFGGGAARARARASMGRYGFQQMMAAQADLAVIQRARGELGVPPGGCLTPTISTTPGARRYSPAITVRGVVGANAIGGLTVHVHRSIARTRGGLPANVLDVSVELAGSDRRGLVVGFQPLHDWTLEPIDLVGQPGVAGPPAAARAMLGSGFGAELGTRALIPPWLAGGQSPDRVVVLPGRPMKGWVRTDCLRSERVSAHKRAHALGAEFVGLRVAFGPRSPGDVAGPWTIDLMLPLSIDAAPFASPRPQRTGVTVRPLLQTRPTRRITRTTRPRPR
jgi:hypothetical protein